LKGVGVAKIFSTMGFEGDTPSRVHFDINGRDDLNKVNKDCGQGVIKIHR
jgi:hypothetical protein